MVRTLRSPLVLLQAAVLWLCSGCGEGPCAGNSCIDAGTTPVSQPRADADVHVVEKDQACSAQSVHAMRGPPRPVDVIFVVDNSGSMAEEIAAIRKNINQDFASIISSSGVDYRVIMISKYGNDSLTVCVDPPLAQSGCNAGIQETNSLFFYHYDQEIGSSDALCQILATFDQPGAQGRAPTGWQAWLRPNAHKAFVVITDDSPLCTYRNGETNQSFGGAAIDPFEDALNFHRALLQRSGAQFGVPPEIKYQFFSIVGLAVNAMPNEPYFPHHGIVTSTCDTAPGPGPTYQALSIITDALRYPVCEGRSFDAVFRVLAKSVIQASQADCEFEVPKAPTDQALVLDSVNLEYHPGDGSAPQRFKQVASAASCKTANSFYISDRIRLCPAACTLVKKDPTPEVQILFGCTGIPQ